MANHAKEVPFHVLEKRHSFGEGRVKCIYIGRENLILGLFKRIVLV